MSIAAAKAFRQYVHDNPNVEAEIRSTFLREGSVDNSLVAKRYGFEFTVDEGNAAWAELADAGGELSDFELEMVSGGGEHPVNTDDSRFAADNSMRANDAGSFT